MGRLDGRVAVITGAARGQGRSHARRLAEEGADIVAIDICADVEDLKYPLATPADLDETVTLVEEAGRRVIARRADVRSQSALDDIVAEGLSEFGRIDIVCANAGIVDYATTWETSEQQWQMQIDILLTGVFHTVKAAIPAMISGRRGGSIIITSSLGGLRGLANVSAYCAAKFGTVGLTQSLAVELAEHHIRVNAVHPTNCNTGMIQNDVTRRLVYPDRDTLPTDEEFRAVTARVNLLPIPWIEPIDVSNAVLWLASDEARYVTGISLPIDAGARLK